MTFDLSGDLACHRCNRTVSFPASSPASGRWVLDGSRVYCSRNCWMHDVATGLAHQLARDVEHGCGWANGSRRLAHELVGLLGDLHAVWSGCCAECGLQLQPRPGPPDAEGVTHLVQGCPHGHLVPA